MNFDPSITLETERLILRYMRKEDTHDIFININHDKDVLKYFIDKYVEKEEDMTLEKTIDFCLKAERYLFAIESKDTHEVIGMILQCSTASKVLNTSEVGFAIGQKHWNQGYTTEAMKKMINFLFSVGVHKIYASYLIGNNASKRVMEKCQMIYEGTRKDEVYYHDVYHDVAYYYLINPKL